MEKIVAQYGVTVVTQKHLYPRMHLPGTLAGAMEEMDLVILEVGVNSLGEAGGSSTLKKPREAGMHPALPPRIHRLVLGAEL